MLMFSSSYASGAADDAAVLHAAAHYYCASQKGGYGSILAKTATIGGDPGYDLGLRSDLAKRLGDPADKHLVDRLFTYSSEPVNLPTEVDCDCLFLFNRERTAYVGRSKRAFDQKNTAFHEYMGDFEFSLPALSIDGKTALIHASTMSTGFGKAEILVLHKNAKDWAVVDHILMAIN
jgi:hypothetical protein